MIKLKGCLFIMEHTNEQQLQGYSDDRTEGQYMDWVRPCENVIQILKENS